MEQILEPRLNSMIHYQHIARLLHEDKIHELREYGKEIDVDFDHDTQMLEKLDKDRDGLEVELKEQADKLFISGEKIKVPDYWGGYELIPETLEFWQGGKNRLHDRIKYNLSNGNWKKSRLAP